jgi:hypothetical protein
MEVVFNFTQYKHLTKKIKSLKRFNIEGSHITKEVSVMKSKFNFIGLALFSVMLMPVPASAKTWGLGAVIGSPTGLSANYFLSNQRTIHTTLAYGLSGNDNFQLASHYQWRIDNLEIEKIKIGWFYGVGARVAMREHKHHHHSDQNHNHTDLGPSGTIGIFHEFAQVPLEAFLKGNLTVNIIEDTDVDGDVMLGLHYNF